MTRIDKPEPAKPPTGRSGPVAAPGVDARFADAVRRAGGHAKPPATAKDAPVPRAASRAPERREGDAGMMAQPAMSGLGGQQAQGGAAAVSGAPGAPPQAADPSTPAPPLVQAAADAVLPKLAPRLPASFALSFPPNAWPLIRAEGTRTAKGLHLRLTVADAKDEARLRGAVAGLRGALEAAGHAVGEITLLTA